MRPRKILLCVAESERLLGERAFLLETRGYRVLRAQSAGEALGLLSLEVRVLLVDLPLTGREDGLVRRCRELGIRTILVCHAPEGENVAGADAWLAEPALAEEILYRVGLMTARKRGPKPAMKGNYILGYLGRKTR